MNPYRACGDGRNRRCCEPHGGYANLTIVETDRRKEDGRHETCGPSQARGERGDGHGGRRRSREHGHLRPSASDRGEHRCLGNDVGAYLAEHPGGPERLAPVYRTREQVRVGEAYPET